MSRGSATRLNYNTSDYGSGEVKSPGYGAAGTSCAPVRFGARHRPESDPSADSVAPTVVPTLASASARLSIGEVERHHAVRSSSW